MNQLGWHSKAQLVIRHLVEMKYAVYITLVEIFHGTSLHLFTTYLSIR
jgi:hypothetical protein